jgi:hypothetical protein
MMALPDATPLTTPVDEPTVAMAVLLLDHVPPLAVLVSVVEPPTQATAVPPIATGAALTVTTVVTEPQLLA